MQKNRNQQALIGKIPPQSIEIEEIIIGALLIDFREIGNNVLNIILPEMFYKDCNFLIYEAIVDLNKLSKNIDLLTVSNKLKENNNLEKVGGIYFLTQLTSRISSTNNIIDYCNIIIDKYLKRKLIHDLNVNLEKCYEDSVNSEECIDYANKSIDELNELLNIQSRNRSISVILKESLDNAEKRQKYANSGEVIGIPTPLKELDYKTNGWQSGLIIIAARPSMGKTSFALACLKKASEYGKSVCMFSLEMSDVSLMDRLLCAESGVDLGNFKRGEISDVDWQSLSLARNRILNYNLTIDDNSNASMDYIKNKARVLHKKGKCDMIIIDYLQLQEGDKKVNREQQVSDISRKSKLLSKDLNIPIIQLSQLNRECEQRTDKKPMLSDLRESGAIEQNADIVMFLYRPSVYGITGIDGRDLSGEGMVIIAKQREGAIGEVKYKHNKSLTNYFPYLSDSNFEEIPF